MLSSGSLNQGKPRLSAVVITLHSTLSPSINPGCTTLGLAEIQPRQLAPSVGTTACWIHGRGGPIFVDSDGDSPYEISARGLDEFSYTADPIKSTSTTIVTSRHQRRLAITETGTLSSTLPLMPLRRGFT